MESKVWLGVLALSFMVLVGSLVHGARPVSAYACGPGFSHMSQFYSCEGRIDFYDNTAPSTVISQQKALIWETFRDEVFSPKWGRWYTPSELWCKENKSGDKQDRCEKYVSRNTDRMLNWTYTVGVGNDSPPSDTTIGDNGPSLTEVAQAVADSLLEICGSNCGITDVNIDTLIVEMEDPPDIPHLPEPNWDENDEPEEWEIVLYEYNVPYGPIGPSMTFRIRADPLGGFFIEGLWIGAEQFFVDRIMPEFIRWWGEETMWGMSLEPIGWRLHSVILNMN